MYVQLKQEIVIIYCVYFSSIIYLSTVSIDFPGLIIYSS